VFSVACGRHGCYAPQALVDLFKGEQQKNADFSFLKGLKYTRVQYDQTVFLIYDIICQYIVYILERIGQHLPPGLVIDAAIGLFHVHAHKEECFFRYAPTFIPGTGIVSGEILESLWSTLNSISPTARTATLAHRAEILDDHANDSNHKKTIGMVSSLCQSYQRAVDMLEHAKIYHQNLTEQAGITAVEKWMDDIQMAEINRRQDVKTMDIYAAKLAESAPQKQPALGTQVSPLVSWMEISLGVEEKQ
jgi:Kyakuja-Dileera-Zisupton transposase